MPEETNQSQAVKAKPVKKGKGKRVFLLLLSYVIVALTVWQIQSVFYSSPERQEELARQEVQEIVDKVGEIMILPTNEFPQMATINNAAELSKSQAFFASVENGDKVLVYLQDQKAIIYRPSTDKIVNVGPVVADNNQAQQPASAPAPTNNTRATSSNSTSESVSTSDSDSDSDR